MTNMKLDERSLILGVLRNTNGRSLTPVKVQKLFFLVDRKLAEELGGPYFDYQPYDYGPFDQSVYATMTRLEKEGLVAINYSDPWGPRTYSLTDAGQIEAESVWNSAIPDSAKSLLKSLVQFVSVQTFAGLVRSIYREYPEMKAKSVFRD